MWDVKQQAGGLEISNLRVWARRCASFRNYNCDAAKPRKIPTQTKGMLYVISLWDRLQFTRSASFHYPAQKSVGENSYSCSRDKTTF